MARLRRFVLIAPLVAGLAACGGGGDDDSAPTAPRDVTITMRDNDFSMASVVIDKGETIHFVFTDAGKLPHAAYIGTFDQQATYEVAAKAAGVPPADPNGIVVQPGATGELTYTFDDTGQMEIGCHIPGHYPSMASRLIVQ